MNKREASIVSAYTGYLIGEFDDMHKYINEIMGREIFVHELSLKNINDEIHEKSKNDFLNIKIKDDNNKLELDEIERLLELLVREYDYARNVALAFPSSSKAYKDVIKDREKMKKLLNKLKNMKDGCLDSE